METCFPLVLPQAWLPGQEQFVVVTPVVKFGPCSSVTVGQGIPEKTHVSSFVLSATKAHYLGMSSSASALRRTDGVYQDLSSPCYRITMSPDFQLSTP